MKKNLSLAAALAFSFFFAATFASAQPFLPATYYQVGGVSSVVSADFNHDGFPDFACLASISKVTYIEVYLNQGDGTFTHASTSPVATGTFALTAVALNGDKFPDLVALATNGSKSTLSIYLGKGDGSFSPGSLYLVGQGPMQAVAADFNNDGFQDVAVVNATQGGVMLFLGDGKGNLTHSGTYRGTATPFSLAAGDLNGDGFVDLVVGGQTGNLAVLLNQGNGTFSNGATSKIDVSPISIVLADMNNDGRLDAAIASRDSNRVDILIGNGNGTFGSSISFSVANVGTDLLQLVLGDFNLDGNLDVAVAADKGGIIMLYGKGDGELMAPFGVSINGKGASSLATADFNHDGAADLAASDVSNQVGVFLNEQ